MAVLVGIYGKTVPEYVGCVLDTYEHNTHNDSDWYAICWDDENQKIVHVHYDTTRAGGGGYAEIDITEENLRKCYRHLFNVCRNDFDTVFNECQARKVQKGDTVRVIRGRKVRKGTEAKIGWIGSVYNKFSYQVEERVGIDIDDKRVFLPLEYVEVVGWENRMVSGKKRKETIRRMAINRLPVIWRHVFE